MENVKNADKMKDAELAVLDANTLSCIGLKTIFDDLLPQVSVRCFSSFSELMRDTPFAFVHYFVSFSIYFQHVEFFQELGNRVVLLVQNAEQGNRFHLPSLDVSLPEQRLLQQIMHLRQLGGRHDGQRVSETFHGPDYGTRRLTRDPQQQPELTARETEVLALMVQGLINKEIADRLNIGLTTVVTHRRNIQEKTGIRSLSGLTVYAILNGYVRLEDV